MNKILALICLLFAVKANTQCTGTSSQKIIEGKVHAGEFNHMGLISYGATISNDGQPELQSFGWTCNGIGYPTCNGRSVFKYKLTSIPTNATIVSAKLYLYAMQNNINSGLLGSPTFGTANTSFLRKVTSSWDTTGTIVGWSNQPSTTTTAQKTLAQSISTTQDYVVDVTDFVQSWVSTPATNYGMELILQNETAYNSLIFWGGNTTGSTATPAGKYPTLVVCYNLSVVPLNVLSFNGKLTNKTAELSWKTTNEVNTSYTEIEKSYSNDNFTPIEKVNTTNGTSINEYSYIDKNVYSNNHSTVFYRLKFVDKNGSTTYSKTISINLLGTPANTFTIKTNPVHNTILSMNINSVASDKLTMTINDINGRILLTESIKVNAGSQPIDKNISSLQAGVYYVSVIWSNEKVTQKLIKL